MTSWRSRKGYYLFFTWFLPHLSWKETLPRTQGHQGKNQMVGKMSNNGQNDKSTLWGCNKGQCTAIGAPWVSTWNCIYESQAPTKKKQTKKPRRSRGRTVQANVVLPRPQHKNVPEQWPPQEGIHPQPCLHLGLAMWPILINGIRNCECAFSTLSSFQLDTENNTALRNGGVQMSRTWGPESPGVEKLPASQEHQQQRFHCIKATENIWEFIFFLTAARDAITNTRPRWVILLKSNLTKQRFITSEDVREGTEACLFLQNLPQVVWHTFM